MRLTDEQILLLPQLTLLAVALATLLFTASFDWLYPARVLAATRAGIGFALARYHRGRLLDAITAHLTTNLLLGGQWCYW